MAKTVERQGALLPQIAASLGIAVASTNHAPKPLRAVRPPAKKLPPKPPTAPKAAVVEAPTETASEAVVEAVVAEVVVSELAVEAPAESTSDVAEAPATETPTSDES